MTNEYLILDNEEKSSIISYHIEGVSSNIISLKDSEYCYIQFSIESETEAAAKKLSKMDEYINNNFEVTTLTNGCSAYFTKRLYPLISEFEYKLRKLLYLLSATNPNNEKTKEFRNLDKKDFGVIFSMLFTDENFVSESKSKINNQDKKFFSKKEILELIESIKETTAWDELLGKQVVHSLRLNFTEVRLFRNDVMHSHHLTWKKYNEIKTLYSNINDELDDALNNINETNSKIPNRQKFNEILDRIIQSQKAWSMFLQNLPAQTLLQNYSNAISNVSSYLTAISQIPNSTAIQYLKECSRSLSFLCDLPNLNIGLSDTQEDGNNKNDETKNE